MAYQIKFEDQARKEFATIDNSVKIKILKYLKKLQARSDPRSLGKPLNENLAGYWRYRVEDFRIIARIIDTEMTILILAIQKRDIIYRFFPKHPYA